jgi:hypothetical protein
VSERLVPRRRGPDDVDSLLPEQGAHFLAEAGVVVDD